MYEYCLNQLNAHIEQIIALDPDVVAELKQCQSCYIEVHITPLSHPFYIKIIKGKITISQTKPRHNINIHITGSTAAIIELLEKNFSFRHMEEPIEITGDLKELSQIKHILDSSILNLETVLANYTSSWFAQWLIDTQKNFHQSIMQWCNQRTQAYYQYAMYEESIILSPELYQAALEQYNKLRARVEHLESLIQKDAV